MPFTSLRRRFGLATAFLVLLLAPPHIPQAQPVAGSERKSPPAGAKSKAEIEALNSVLVQRQRAEGWRFAVGPTGVLGQPPSVIAGAEQGLPSRETMTARRQFAIEALALYEQVKRRLRVKEPDLGVSCRPTAAAFSWGAAGYDLPPRDQQIRGLFPCASCWAFAPVAAYESSFLITNGVKADKARPAVEASEQDLLNCTDGSTCDLGHVKGALDRLVERGTASRRVVSYEGVKDNQCPLNVERPYSLVAWGPVNLDATEVSTPRRLKDVLCTFGPVTSRIMISPSFEGYKGSGVYHQTERDFTVHTEHRGHHLVIIGWDDTKGEKGAWLVKNSWVDRWGMVDEGMPGYAWIEYGANFIGHYANWVKAFHRSVPPSAMEPRLSELKKKYILAWP